MCKSRLAECVGYMRLRTGDGLHAGPSIASKSGRRRSINPGWHLILYANNSTVLESMIDQEQEPPPPRVKGIRI